MLFCLLETAFSPIFPLRSRDDSLKFICSSPFFKAFFRLSRYYSYRSFSLPRNRVLPIRGSRVREHPTRDHKDQAEHSRPRAGALLPIGALAAGEAFLPIYMPRLPLPFPFSFHSFATMVFALRPDA